MASLHFSLGEDFGKRITEIAQEKLIYDYSPKKAIETFTLSFYDMTEKLALRCLSGKDLKIVVDGDEVELTTDDVEEYPTIDFEYLVERWKSEFDKTFKVFEKPLIDRLSYGTKRNISISINVLDILKGYQNDDRNPYDFFKEVITDELLYEPYIDYDYTKTIDDLEYFKIFKDWKTLNKKRLFVMKWLADNNFIDEYPVDYENKLIEYSLKVEACLNWNDPDHVIRKDPLESYIEASIENDEIDRLEPISPTEFRNACWVSPDGEIYGMNGEIGNMLHMNIADILVNQGVIESSNRREENNPYNILENNGWVKLHNDWVMFEQNIFTDNGEQKQFMTDKQQEVIAEYLHNHFEDIGKFGIMHTPISSFIFKQMDKFAINKLFDF
ncbi:MAG: hypothetical protein J1F35_08330 [Erysipelotrichales bacterium]|nr:hypothetical protein [Erysipelotrichales bacterium]